MPPERVEAEDLDYDVPKSNKSVSPEVVRRPEVEEDFYESSRRSGESDLRREFQQTIYDSPRRSRDSDSRQDDPATIYDSPRSSRSSDQLNGSFKSAEQSFCDSPRSSLGSDQQKEQSFDNVPQKITTNS